MSTHPHAVRLERWGWLGVATWEQVFDSTVPSGRVLTQSLYSYSESHLGHTTYSTNGFSVIINNWIIFCRVVWLEALEIVSQPYAFPRTRTKYFRNLMKIATAAFEILNAACQRSKNPKRWKNMEWIRDLSIVAPTVSESVVSTSNHSSESKPDDPS